MKKQQDIFDIKLDAEEQEISEAFDCGKFESVPNLEAELARAKKVAENTVRKDERITLRLSGRDLSIIKEKAAYKGLPYQTFIASILHQFAAGYLREVAS